jgi:hypothetical protein
MTCTVFPRLWNGLQRWGLPAEKRQFLPKWFVICRDSNNREIVTQSLMGHRRHRGEVVDEYQLISCVTKWRTTIFFWSCAESRTYSGRFTPLLPRSHVAR